MSRQRATAFVPGHVTAFFSAHSAERPVAAGSRGGAGVTLTDGVTVRVSAADEAGASGESGESDESVVPGQPAGSRTIDGEPGTIGAVEDVLAALGLAEDDGTPRVVDVAVETDLPIGAGFGVSGRPRSAPRSRANDAFEPRAPRTS